MQPGTKVLVVFDPQRWPIHQATYTYEGKDESGWWVRRSDGVQRYFLREDVHSVTPVEEGPENENPETPEAPY